jgi:hypothetical protein
MNMVRLKMPFQHLALLLPGQFMELAIERLLSAFRYPHDVLLAFPLRVA